MHTGRHVSFQLCMLEFDLHKPVARVCALDGCMDRQTDETVFISV